MKKTISMRRILLWTGIILLVIGIDRLTKYLAVQYLKPVDTVPLIQDALHLTYCTNKGAAFGMLADHRAVFMIVSCVAILGMIVLLGAFHRAHPLFGTSLAMIIGGGIGNMIDRVVLGEVIDFIDFRLIHFAVFNGADSFVTVGCVLLGVYLLFVDRKAKSPIFTDEKKNPRHPMTSDES